MWLALAGAAPLRADDLAPFASAERGLREGRGADAATRQQAEHALAVAEATGSWRDQAAALRLLGRIRLERADLAEARDAFQRALAVSGAHRSEPGADVAAVTFDLADVLLRLGDREGAEGLLDALPVPGEDALPPRLLELCARVHRDEGAYGLAFDAARLALSLRQAGGTEADPRDLIATFNLLGELEWYRGRYPSSREWHEKALGLARAGLGEGHPLVGVSALALALTAYELGDIGETRRLEELALAVAQAARGPAHPETLDSLQALANLHLDEADYEEARALYERAQAGTTARFGPASDEVANLLHNLGLLHLRMGQPARAREDLEGARRIWTGNRGPTHPFVARALDLLGTALEEAGDLAGAEAALRRSAAIREGASGRDVDLAWTLIRLGLVRARQGAAAEAARLADRAGAVCATLPRPLAPEAVGTLALLADLEASLGRRARAARRLQDALAASERLFGADHPQTAEIRARAAEASWTAGRDSARALRQALRAEETGQRHVRRTVRFLTEGQALAFATRRSVARDVLLSVAAVPGRRPAVLGQVLGALAGGRALVLDEMASRVSRSADDPGGAPGAAEAARRRLAHVLYREASRSSTAGAAQLAALQRELEEAERAEVKRGPRALPRSAAVAGVAGLRHRLPAGGVLVSFFKYRAAGTPGEAPPNRYLAFVLRGDSGALSARALGPATAIDDAIAAWRREVEDVHRALDDPAASERASRRAGARLRRLLWDPVAPLCRGARLVLLVPDGQVHLVGFSGLPVGASGYLAEQAPPLHTLSAERDLLRDLAPARAPRLLALGGPDYGKAAAPAAEAGPPGTSGRAGDCGPHAFVPLPQAAGEAADVSRLWAGAVPGGSVDVLVARAADEAAFKRLAPRASALHLATHGFFVGPRCAGGAGASAAAAVVWAANPLLRSGLALAGSNVGAPEAGQEDGLLTAAEVARLDLSGLRWAVLSSCGSGLGPIQDGEGVLGLQRAFSIAGAHSVVMSLWAVEDQEARLWIAALYTHLLGDRRPLARSVRGAQVQAIARLRARTGVAPPALWGAFVAAGDWN